MKKKDNKNSAGKSASELQKEVSKLKTELAKTVLHESVNQAKNTSGQGTIKRTIARHLTAIRSQQGEQMMAKTDGKKSD